MDMVLENVDDLTPYDKNPRVTKNLGALIQSMEKFGFTAPVIAYKQGKTKLILAGHQRVLAAKESGIEKIPVCYPGFKSLAEARTYVIADNKLAEVVAGWDKETLSAELIELKRDFNVLNIPGFRQDELNKLTKPDDPDDPKNKSPVYQITPDLHEKYESVLIFCRNDIDWTHLVQLLGIEHRMAPMKTDAKLCHVLEFSDFIKALEEREHVKFPTNDGQRPRSDGSGERVPESDSPGPGG